MSKSAHCEQQSELGASSRVSRVVMVGHGMMAWQRSSNSGCFRDDLMTYWLTAFCHCCATGSSSWLATSLRLSIALQKGRTRAPQLGIRPGGILDFEIFNLIPPTAAQIFTLRKPLTRYCTAPLLSIPREYLTPAII